MLKKYSFLLKNLGIQQILCSEIFMRFFFPKMLQINLGNFGNFSLLGKVINVDLFHFCPKKLGTLKNLPVLKFFWHFGNSYSAKK